MTFQKPTSTHLLDLQVMSTQKTEEVADPAVCEVMEMMMVNDDCGEWFGILIMKHTELSAILLPQQLCGN